MNKEEKIDTLINDFDELLLLCWKEDLSGTKEYRKVKIEAKKILIFLWPVVESYNQTTSVYDLSGLSAAASEIVRPLAFPARFVDIKKIDEEIFQELKDVLLECFVFGLLLHLHAWKPSTGDTAAISDINLDQLYEDFLPKLLFFSFGPWAGNKEQEAIHDFIFQAYYHKSVELFLGDKIKLGWWKKARAKVYFRNLFLSGLLFGGMVDFKAKESGS